MKWLTIKQPWAGLIFSDTRMGKANYINRKEPISYIGSLAIHASFGYNYADYRYLSRMMGIECDQHPLTKIKESVIGVVEIVSIETMDDKKIWNITSPWFRGPYGWFVRNPRLVKPRQLSISVTGNEDPRLFDINDKELIYE